MKCNKSMNMKSSMSNETSNPNWSFFIDLIRSHEQIDSSIIINNINMIISNYISNIGLSPIKKTINEFKMMKNINPLNESFEKVIETIEKENLFYYYSYLIQILFKNLIDQSIFSKKMNEKIEFDSCNYIYIVDSIQYSGQMNRAMIKIDKSLNIYLQIQYENIMEKIKERGKEILRKNYSKFIPKIIENNDDNQNRVIIPYFVNGTLHMQLNQPNKAIEFSIVDKIVIILEIAMALNDLHNNNKYHGDLSSKFISLNSMKDAYISFFFYDRINEPNMTQLKGPIMYRMPENFYDTIDDEAKKNKLADIYSFGVLMFEILTEKSPDNFLLKKPRAERMAVLNGDFCDFLFHNGNFSEDLIDFKKVIQECMRQNEDNYMGNIINMIKKLPIYEYNKTEIEFRINNAVSGSNLQCSFVDLIENYYICKKNSSSLIQKIMKNLNIADSFMEKSDDLIKEIFRIFDINMIDVTYVFNDLVNHIIQNHDKCQLEDFSDLSNDLFQLSTKTINETNSKINADNMDYCHILSISNLADFINKNNLKFSEKQSLIFIYFIAKELSLIHSHNLYHGELSTQSIGVYFNNETKSFVPSLLLYYCEYIKKKKNQTTTYKKFYFDDEIEKKQIKDMKRFIKIIGDSSVFEIKNELINEIRNLQSMNSILNCIYNYIIQNKSDDIKKSFHNENAYYNYSSFYISYQSLIDIYQKIVHDINQKSELYKNCINRIACILNDIDNVFSFYTLNQKLTIEELLSYQSQHLTKELDNSSIETIQKTIKNIQKSSLNIYINNNLDEMYDYDKLNNIVIEEKNGIVSIIRTEKVENKKIKPVKKIHFQTVKKKVEKQNRSWFLKFITRRIEISELTYQSVCFFMRRYLLNLNPTINFRIIVKIINKNYSKYQNMPIKANYIINIANELGFHNSNIEDGNIIIVIQNKK